MQTRWALLFFRKTLNRHLNGVHVIYGPAKKIIKVNSTNTGTKRKINSTELPQLKNDFWYKNSV